MEEKKKHMIDFSTLSVDDMKTKKTKICFVGIKLNNNSQNTTIFKNRFSYGRLLVGAADIW